MENLIGKRGRGRQALPDEQRKKHRGVSLTDAEYEEFLKQAGAAGYEGRPSAFLVKKLRLS